ncbi:MAG: thiamine phosphate synthase [Zoogloeaceae bacterium]|nr:thiamine phosphate synthase [Zoogloeaceae bacterium]
MTVRPEVRPGLYLVTPDWADTARLERAVMQALVGRPALLQYRSKQSDPALRLEQAGRILRRCREAGVAMIVNDDLDLMRAVDADGLHIGRDDGDVAVLRNVVGEGRLLGVSCYDDLGRAQTAEAAGADYVAFGAIYPSATKPAATSAALGLLANARCELRCPIAAIGGISLPRAAEVVAAGAQLLAVISDVFEDADPAGRAAAYGRLWADPEAVA